MRGVFFVAVAVAIFARSSAVAAFTNADEAKLLSEAAPGLAADAVISGESRERFLRVAHPEDDDLAAPADDGKTEERAPNYKSLNEILKKLDEEEMINVSKILGNMGAIHADHLAKARAALNAAHERGAITANQLQAALAKLV
uniref:RxLR effector protein n=1 Tax=Phytophthora sojae TaxID=67593 RepID=G1FSB4_PHYSO|nr:Avh238 [Phytophthora sojae]